MMPRLPHTVARLVPLLGAIAAAALLPACGLFTTPQQVLARADRNLAAQDYRAAEVDLKNLVAKQPNDRALRLKLAQALLHTGAYVESESNYRKTQQLGTPWTSIVSDLAEALIGEGRPQQALDLLAAHPLPGKPNARTLTLRGRALLALGKRDEAHTALTQAIALDAADMPARVALVALLEQQGDWSGAKAALDAASAADPNDFSVHLALGRWYAHARNLNGAHAELTRALDLAVAGIRAGREPWFDEYNVIAPLAENDLMRGDLKSAAARALRLGKLAPHTPATLLVKARVELAQKHADEARATLQGLLSQDPQNVPAKVLLGAASAASGQFEQADMYLTAALAAAPGDLAARKLLAEVQLKEHKPHDALRTASDPNAALNADLLALAAQASAQSGDLSGATTYMERSEKAAPQDVRHGLELAAAYLAEHRAADAVKLLQGLKVSDRLGQARERLLFSALSQAGTPADVQSEAKRYAAAHPHDGSALLLAAQALASTRDADGAHDLINQAARAEPTSPQPWIALGILEGTLAKRDAASAAFQHALKVDPRSVGALLGEARLFMASNDAARAAAPLAQARRIAPDDAGVMLLSGALALAQHDGKGAVDAFERLAARYPKSAILQADLARALALAKRPADARGAIAQAVKLDPSYWPALVIDVSLALDEHDVDGAEQLLPQLRASKAPAPVVHTIEGDVAAHQGNLKEALRDYQEAAKTAPSAMLALKMASASHALHLPDPDAPLRAWLQHSPHDNGVRLILAGLLLEHNDRSAAARAYETVLADEPNQIIALNNLAWLRLEAGQVDSAVELARKAYAIAPKQASVGDTLGWALVQSGHDADAVSILRAAHAEAPTDEQIHLHWATALAKTGARADARRELQSIIEAQPNGPQGTHARALLTSLSGTPSR